DSEGHPPASWALAGGHSSSALLLGGQASGTRFDKIASLSTAGRRPRSVRKPQAVRSLVKQPRKAPVSLESHCFVLSPPASQPSTAEGRSDSVAASSSDEPRAPIWNRWSRSGG
ncbi:unnamed protein product, partial [Polarella glacialis]